jgi:type 1 glutamine amidotransferase
MKKIRLLLAALMALFTFAGAAHAADTKPLRVLVTYGGHAFSTNAFFAMWDKLPGVTYAKCVLPKQADMLKPGLEKEFDVVVFYDMVKGFSPEQQKAFVELANTGIGLVPTHHTLGAHDGWREYWNIIGGHYLHKVETIGGKEYAKSSYDHGQDLAVKVVDTAHPVTRGVKDFSIHDETYGRFYVAPESHVLLTTDHPKCGRDIAWTKTYGKSRVCYLIFGHDEKAWQNPSYQTLLLNAMHWAAEGSKK